MCFLSLSKQKNGSHSKQDDACNKVEGSQVFLAEFFDSLRVKTFLDEVGDKDHGGDKYEVVKH